MKPSMFGEEQIVAILKEVELGAKVTEVCRRHGFPKRRTTAGRRAMRGWTSPSCGIVQDGGYPQERSPFSFCSPDRAVQVFAQTIAMSTRIRLR